jgi:hypothetical protein
MANNGIPAVFGPIKYFWAQIKAHGILDAYDYKGLIPIIPVQDEPALLQAIGESDGVSTAPYIVYTWYSNGIDSDWFMTYDTIVFTVKAAQDTKVARQLVLLAKTLFRRWDESAQAVNAWVEHPRASTGVWNGLRRLRGVQLHAHFGVGIDGRPAGDGGPGTSSRDYHHSCRIYLGWKRPTNPTTSIICIWN